jgi:hypothetical protein
MKKGLKNLKLIAGLSTTVALFAVVPVVHGGLFWTGIDSVVESNGHVMNIWVEWPTGRECDINGPISVDVHTRGVVRAESVETFTCGEGLKTVRTQTKVKHIGNPAHFNVEQVIVPSSDTFPVQVKVYKDGHLAETCHGLSNLPFDCQVISLNKVKIRSRIDERRGSTGSPRTGQT